MTVPLPHSHSNHFGSLHSHQPHPGCSWNYSCLKAIWCVCVCWTYFGWCFQAISRHFPIHKQTHRGESSRGRSRGRREGGGIWWREGGVHNSQWKGRKRKRRRGRGGWKGAKRIACWWMVGDTTEGVGSPASVAGEWLSFESKNGCVITQSTNIIITTIATTGIIIAISILVVLIFLTPTSTSTLTIVDPLIGNIRRFSLTMAYMQTNVRGISQEMIIIISSIK